MLTTGKVGLPLVMLCLRHVWPRLRVLRSLSVKLWSANYTRPPEQLHLPM